MRIEAMKESSWFTTIWKSSRKSKVLDPEKPVIGIMSFEVSKLMTKVANLWQCLSDNKMSRLREELTNSVGTQKLVSEDYDHLMDLALIEIVDNIKCVAVAVARLGKKCTDPVYWNLEHVFDNPMNIDVNWCGWEYKIKKMEKRVRKMKRFSAVNSQLCEELEVLSELESGFKRIVDSNENRLKLNEFEKKVLWQREEVDGLRQMSTWVRSYDYIVRLLLRSLFTIVQRVKVVFGMSLRISDSRCFVRSNSISALSVYPSDEKTIQRSVSNLGDKPKKRLQIHYPPPRAFCGPHASVKSRSLAQIGPLGRCMTSDLIDSPKVNGTFQTTFLLDSKKRMSKGQNGKKPPTLGDAALALHYANVIVFIERLAISPHFISPESRDDLFYMLTTSIKNSLRQKIISSSKVYDRDFAHDWSSSMQKTLDWLTPLAHNMIKWHSERNFEKQQMGPGGTVLLVNTLHYADQAKSEDAITDLVLGLHYISRFGREVDEKSFMGSACGTECEDYNKLASLALYD